MPRSVEDPENPWLYSPSLVAAIMVAHVYFITTLVHVFQAIHYRARFCIPLLVGGLRETVGYAVRAAGTKYEQSIALYATQLTLVVLAPACKNPFVILVDILLTIYEVVAAFNYMLFGRILRTYSSGTKSTALRVSDSWVTRIFVGFDVISFLTQSAGAAMLAGSNGDIRKSDTGEKIVIGGLILQLIAFGFFTAAAVRFHLKLKRWQKLSGSVAHVRAREWRILLLCLYASCILIMLRMYRIPSHQLCH